MDSVQFENMMLDVYSVDLSKPENIRNLTKSIKTLSEEYPKIETFTLETIAGQTTYDVKHDGLIRVKEVYFSRAITPYSGIQYRGGAIKPSVSQMFTSLCEQSIYDKMMPIDSEIVDYNRFNLIPTPSHSGIKVAYECDMYRDISEIPEIFEECLIDLYFFYESDSAVRKNIQSNQGNVYKFDRRGNINADDGNDNSLEVSRAKSMQVILKKIRSIVMRIRK